MGGLSSKFRIEKSGKKPTVLADVRTYDTSILSLPDEATLHLLSFLSPKDLSRCAMTCRKLRILAYDPSLWREIHLLHWTRGMWTKEKCDAFKEAMYRDFIPVYIFSAFDEIMNKSYSLLDKLQVPMKLFGSGVRVLNFSHSDFMTEELFNNVIKLCPNVQEIYVRCPGLATRAFERVWDVGAAKRLSKLVFVNCENLSDLAFLYLIRCWVENDEEFMKLNLTEKEKALCCESPKQEDFEELDTLEEVPNDNCDDEEFTKLDLTEEEKALCSVSPKQGDFEQRDTLEEVPNDNCDDEDTLSRNYHLTKCVGLRKLDLCGCRLLTDKCLMYLGLSPNVTNNLEQLSLAGCPYITGRAMTSFVEKCPKIQGDKLKYCSHVYDGPFPTVAKGCEFCEDSNRGFCSTMANI